MLVGAQLFACVMEEGGVESALLGAQHISNRLKTIITANAGADVKYTDGVGAHLGTKLQLYSCVCMRDFSFKRLQQLKKSIQKY